MAARPGGPDYETTRGRLADGSFVASALRNVKDGKVLSMVQDFYRTGGDGKVVNPIATNLVYASSGGSDDWAGSATAVADNSFLFARGTRHEITVYSPDGAVKRIIRLDRPLTRFTEANFAHFKQVKTERYKAAGMPPRTYDFSQTTYSEYLAPIVAIVVDSEGDIWAKEGAPVDDADPGNWMVFDSAGRYRASVSTPAGLTVREIGRDYVLGTCITEPLELSVCMFSLSRKSP
jgi:hypothetical protein